MKHIKVLVDRISDEVNDAKEYAEEYLLHKSEGSVNNRYKEMAEDELKHAGYIHDEAMRKIDELKTVYTPPTGMEEIWEKSHKEFVEKVAWVKQMLSM